MTRNRKKLTTKRCANCGREFQAKSAKAVYCKPSCKQAAYRKRNRVL